MRNDIREKLHNRINHAGNLWELFDRLRAEGYLVYEVDDSPRLTDGSREIWYTVENTEGKSLVDVMFMDKTEQELKQEWKPRFKQYILQINY